MVMEDTGRMSRRGMTTTRIGKEENEGDGEEEEEEEQ